MLWLLKRFLGGGGGGGKGCMGMSFLRLFPSTCLVNQGPQVRSQASIVCQMRLFTEVWSPYDLTRQDLYFVICLKPHKMDVSMRLQDMFE